MRISKTIHVAANDIISLFLMTNIPLKIHTTTFFLIHSSVLGHLGCFHVLAIVNSATVNIRVHISDHAFLQIYYVVVIFK